MALSLAARRPLHYALLSPSYRSLQYSFVLDAISRNYRAEMKLNIVKRRKHDAFPPILGRGNAYTDRPHPPHSPSWLSTTTSEYPKPFEIDAGDRVTTVTFTTNGEYLVGGGEKGVQVWQVQDGKRVATMKMQGWVHTVAASRNGRWIAGGTCGEVSVWDATSLTYERVFTEQIGFNANDIDFSPDSNNLVSLDGRTATIWDIAACQKVRTLGLNDQDISVAKYFPWDDRIATATYESVQVWDSNDGRLLADVKVEVRQGRPSLFWWNNHLLVLTRGNKIKEINPATGTTVSELSILVSDSLLHPRIAMPRNETFIAYFSEKNITFWDTTTRSQIGPFQHSNHIDSVACSPNGQLLAIASERKITTIVTSSVMFPLGLEPELDVDGAALDAWKHGQLSDAEELLSSAITKSENKHYLLASRALVRARLGHWDAALVDAKESVEIQRTLVGYVAKCMALVGMGEEDKGIRACDVAFHYFHLHHFYILVIKAVVLFMAGKHIDAISRMDDLLTDVGPGPELCVVQAYMHLALGNRYMENSDYERAIQSFEDARIRLGNGLHRPPLIVLLISGWQFDDLAVVIQQRLYEAFLAVDHARETGKPIARTTDQRINMAEPIKAWVPEFKCRCGNKLEDFGDRAMNAKQHDDAISQYTAALSLDPVDPQHLLIKRSKAYAEKGMWRRALNDANEAIELNPSSPLGYERKYAAQYGMGHHEDAMDAFETMVSRMSESSDPEMRKRSRQYVRPEQIKEVIRISIEDATRNLPEVLINTSSGRLCNKSEQAAAFESTPAFSTLITSVTTPIDYALIERVVGEFYRYATLSHTWEGNEPLYEKVIKTVVYDLEASPTHRKLQMFCEIVRDEGFNWAWSDTCCINKADHFVLQESLVSMFKWYEGSTITIIFLCDVERLAELGALMMSRWNSRGWTLQEYHASKVVRIYTKDWTPYLGLTVYNHKEAPEIISEMERATGISTQSLVALCPGLNDIREKLRLASTRRTTRVEDAAYSLLGIFSMPLPITYGEGDKALGRLLSQLLTSSGDTSILAWTGRSGSFNSCLPTSTTVFSQPVTSHIPLAITSVEMNPLPYISSSDHNLLTRLYDQLNALPLPLFAIQRMKLPCLAFKVDLVSTSWGRTEHVFRVQADILGIVDIKTDQDLSRLDSLHLIHPWIDFLLDRYPVGTNDTISEENCLIVTSRSSLTVSPLAQQIRIYQFLARLRQPFGALLFTPTRRNVEEYKRVATQSLITVQVEELTSATLERLIQGVRVLDVL